MKAEKTILYIILGIVLFNFFNRQCSQTAINDKPTTSTVIDTVWQTKIDTFKIKTTHYKTVYVDTTDISKFIETQELDSKPKGFTEAKKYQDTLSNDDIDIYTYNLIEGNLLDSKLSYNLKVPREIITTKTIEHPKTFRSGLYVFSELGGNTNMFNNMSLGLQYNRKGKWFLGYRANLNQLPRLSHNISVGVRLFK